MKKMNTQELSVNFLYKNVIGRAVLRLLVNKQISIFVGKLLDSKFSCKLIDSFVKNNDIDMSEYMDVEYQSFNDFFCRRIKPEARPVNSDTQAFISPCDSRLTVYDITEDMIVNVKNTPYSMKDLLRSKKLAKYYKNGKLMLFRLSVDDYHRYAYIESGVKSKQYRINGVLHTVQPLANDVYPIYKENTREFCLINSERAGKILMMEVGALLVGKIVNDFQGECSAIKGEEKGHFEYGGSTIIVCVKEGVVDIDKDILEKSYNNIETRVKFGQKIGEYID